jgi:hypothetical protein
VILCSGSWFLDERLGVCQYHFIMHSTLRLVFLLLVVTSPLSAAEDVAATRARASQWRADHRTVDLHMHIEAKEERYRRALKIMDAAGIGIGVNLSGGTVTKGAGGEPSRFEINKDLVEQIAPGRFLLYFNLDFKGWDDPDWSAKAVKQAEVAKALGAAGFKQEKSLGLYLRDGAGKLIKIDDPKLDPFWQRLGELGLPVSIHVGDPIAFWLPFNERNERWEELKDHKTGGSVILRFFRHARIWWTPLTVSLRVIGIRHSSAFTSLTTRKTSNGWTPR